jgi:phage tail P2-like protein
MINLKASDFTSILPTNLASQTEVQAIAYALGRQITSVCAYADSARVYAALSQVPENVIDVLAAELRTPAYDENYSITVKRTLVEGTLTFYMKMGTPYAVNRIIEAIFETGYIKEWFDYGGEPYHFKAYTTNPAITQDDVVEFTRVLSTVKRLSAWLDEIILDLATETMDFYIGFWVQTGEFVRLKRATL